MRARADEVRSMPIGLAENIKGVPFNCDHCKWFDDGKCWNPNPRLEGKHVEPKWCCNLFRHAGMKVIIR